MIEVTLALALFALIPEAPPLDEYMMPSEAEIALARRAAPERVSSRATVKVLTRSGFEVASEGDDGFVCLGLRGFSAPTFPPFVSDDAGTPFTVVVIPVHGMTAIQSKSTH